MRLLAFFFFASVGITALAQNKPATPTAGKVGYVDVENAITQFPEYKQLETKMQETRTRLSNEMTSKQQEFERAYGYYMQNAKALADTTRVRLEGTLQRMDGELQQFQYDAQNTLDNTKKLALAQVYLKLGGVIREVAMENGYLMILPYRVGNGELIIHSDPKFDVTQLVVKKYLDSK